MRYYSTRGISSPVDFATATLQGQPPDKGLYYPESVPNISTWMTQPLDAYSPQELAFRVLLPYTGKSLPEEVLYQICSETIAFPFPLIRLSPQVYVLELFHGPTLAFKDVGARFMSRCLGWFNRSNNRRVTVLVATSGDTGGAVADGFSGVEGVEVIILFPKGKVSPVQEWQLTSCGGNVHALEVQGSFDQCQAMVKEAFADAELQSAYRLTSANSINVARWLPQQLYYFFALQQWTREAPPVFSVPSGNFGNICAGILAADSGLPVTHFMAACNANDTIPQYLATGIMPEKTVIPTVSNAMDVASPSNFVRILEIFGREPARLRTGMSAVSIDDETTRHTMAQALAKYDYLTDPHGAVGLKALEMYLTAHPGAAGIFLETAHPVKFPDVVAGATGREVPLPPAVEALRDKAKRSTVLDASFDDFKSWMMNR